MPIPAIAMPIIGIIGKVLDRVIPDKAAREKAEMELAMFTASAEFQSAAKQAEINLAEAQHPSIFVAGWRPWIGWVCGVAVAYNFVVYPLLLWGLALWPQPGFSPPPLFQDSLLELVLGMLGIAGLRTYEKFKGVARDRMKPKPAEWYPSED